jgi:hypothetical protein
VTIISDRMSRSVFDEGSQLFANKPIKFYYNPFDIGTNGKHWWLNVTSSDAENIREFLGLSRIPYFGLHLTIGHANEKNIQHSEYILPYPLQKSEPSSFTENVRVKALYKKDLFMKIVFSMDNFSVIFIRKTSFSD